MHDLFVLAPLVWLSVVAALGAGITLPIANSATRTLLSKSAGADRMAPVMAVWAIAWRAEADRFTLGRASRWLDRRPLDRSGAALPALSRSSS